MLARNDPFFYQLITTRQIHFGIVQRCLVFGQVALRTRQVGFNLPRIEREQQLSFADLLALFEVNFFQLRVDLRFDLHRGIGLHVADGAHLYRHIALLHFGYLHGNCRSGSSGRSRFLIGAAGGCDQ